jgi:hypothetical protein
MNTKNNTSRILGAAFLLQFITSVGSGLLIQPAWLVPGNIHETMLKIADNPGLMRTNIVVDMLTAMGVIFLGAMLYVALRKYNEKIALIGLGFYILEGALLAASRSEAFSLLRISQEYVAAGNPAYLQTMANPWNLLDLNCTCWFFVSVQSCSITCSTNQALFRGFCPCGV